MANIVGNTPANIKVWYTVTTGTWVWDKWNNTSVNSTASTTWTAWNTSITQTSRGYNEYTNYEVRSNSRIEEESRRWKEEYKKQQAEEAERRRIAAERAEELLLTCLNQDQRKDYRTHRHFVVTGRSGARYRVRLGRMANVDVINRKGFISHRLCFHPSINCPEPDVMLAQKLMLEDDEDNVLKIANRHTAFDEARHFRVLTALN